MPTPIQDPQPAVQIQSDFGIKGRIRMQVDETIVPVRQVYGRSGIGTLSGHWARFANPNGAVAGTFADTVTPYAHLQGLAIPPPFPAEAGRPGPTPQSTDIWLVECGISIDTPANLTEAGVWLRYPGSRPPEVPGGVHDILVQSALAADFMSLTDPTGTDFFARVATRVRLPIYIPRDGSLDARILITGAADANAFFTFWAGPTGTRPPRGA